MAFTSGEDWQVSLFYRDSGSGTIAENAIGIHSEASSTASDVSTVVQASWQASQLDWVAATATINTVRVRDLAGIAATQDFPTDGTSKWSGGGLGQSLPQVAGIVRLQTTVAGRSHRGRVFIPFVGEGETDAGSLIDVAATGTAWTAFIAALSSSSPVCELSIVSRKLSALFVVDHVAAQTITGTQRRRVARLR